MAKSSNAKKSVQTKKAVKKIVKPVAKSKTKAKAPAKNKTTVKIKAKANSKPAAKAVKTTIKLAKQTVKAAPAVKQVVKAAPVAVKEQPKAVTPIKASFDFKVNDFLVYPTHGVGHVTAIEKTEIAGTAVTLYVLNFEKEKMTLRVPVTRAAAVGLRRLSSSDQITKALSVLKGKPKTARGMWSRRATEYGQKINSGNIEAIAQVVRDLHKNVDDPDRSYSERVIYESAFDRLCGEYAAVNKIDTKQAQEILVKALNKKAA